MFQPDERCGSSRVVDFAFATPQWLTAINRTCDRPKWQKVLEPITTSSHADYELLRLVAESGDGLSDPFGIDGLSTLSTSPPSSQEKRGTGSSRRTSVLRCDDDVVTIVVHAMDLRRATTRQGTFRGAVGSTFASTYEAVAGWLGDGAVVLFECADEGSHGPRVRRVYHPNDAIVALPQQDNRLELAAHGLVGRPVTGEMSHLWTVAYFYVARRQSGLAPCFVPVVVPHNRELTATVGSVAQLCAQGPFSGELMAQCMTTIVNWERAANGAHYCLSLRSAECWGTESEYRPCSTAAIVASIGLVYQVEEGDYVTCEVPLEGLGASVPCAPVEGYVTRCSRDGALLLFDVCDNTGDVVTNCLCTFLSVPHSSS